MLAPLQGAAVRCCCQSAVCALELGCRLAVLGLFPRCHDQQLRSSAKFCAVFERAAVGMLAMLSERSGDYYQWLLQELWEAVESSRSVLHVSQLLKILKPIQCPHMRLQIRQLRAIVAPRYATRSQMQARKPEEPKEVSERGGLQPAQVTTCQDALPLLTVFWPGLQWNVVLQSGASVRGHP